jgi:hypothetical protein
MLLLHAEGTKAATVETGWSNGGKPAEVPSVALCPNSSFINSWIIGEGNVSSSVGPLLSIVFVQARCSDGSLLAPIRGGSAEDAKHDSQSNSGLSSASGYTCSRLLGYNNGGNWMMNFLGVGQQPADDPAGKGLQLDCARVPQDYVAVGYSAFTGAAVDAIKFVMAAPPAATAATAAAPVAGSAPAAVKPGLFLPVPPGGAAATKQLPAPAAAPAITPAAVTSPAVPTQQQPPAPATAMQPAVSPAAAVTASPVVAAPTPAATPVPTPAPTPPAEGSGGLSTGTIVGIVASSLVGLSAVVAIAYNVWKWVNKHKLVVAKHGHGMPRRPTNTGWLQAPLRVPSRIGELQKGGSAERTVQIV